MFSPSVMRDVSWIVEWLASKAFSSNCLFLFASSILCLWLLRSSSFSSCTSWHRRSMLEMELHFFMLEDDATSSTDKGTTRRWPVLPLRLLAAWELTHSGLVTTSIQFCQLFQSRISVKTSAIYEHNQGLRQFFFTVSWDPPCTPNANGIHVSL